MHLNILLQRISNDKELLVQLKKYQTDRDKLDFLLESGFNKKTLMSEFERYFDVKYVDILNIDIDEEIISEFNIKELVKKNIIPYKFNKQLRTYYFTCCEISPGRDILETIRHVESNGFKVSLGFSFDFEINDKLKNLVDGNANKIKKIKDSEERVVDEYDILSNPSDWVNEIITEGIRNRSSDIHVEIKKDCLLVRYRIDGYLIKNNRYPFSHSDSSKVIRAIKSLANMKIEEIRKPQDGRIGDFEVDGKLYDLRVSSVNTIYGEKIVFRIIRKQEKILSFKEIGLSNSNIKIIKKALNSPNGIIYVGGSTGSGKTTTLYTMIDYLNDSNYNLYTLENPVEKEIEGINQVQINDDAGITYSNTLRALLRQDPDVMIVGEVRDKETADLSLNASLAGHLILTTIHANNSLDILNRLYEMDLQPYLVGSTSKLLMSQRLLRRLCNDCKIKRKINKDEVKLLNFILKRNNMNKENLNIDNVEDIEVYDAVGCPNCNNGYVNRIAIAELVYISDTIQEMIADRVSTNKIKEQAYKEGFIPLDIDGLIKVLNGEIDFKELKGGI